MIFLGIDPGITGAVARYDDEADLVTVARDFKSLGDIAQAITDLSPGAAFAAIELVSSRPGQGVSSVFSFGRSTGVALGALLVAKVPFIEVTPQRWIAFHTDPFRAFDSGFVAKKRWPRQDHLFRRVKDHNTADACLIAAYMSHEYRSTHGLPQTSRQKNRHLTELRPPVKVSA